MTDFKSWVFHHWFDSLNNLFSRILFFEKLTASAAQLLQLPFLSLPFDHLFNYEEHCDEPRARTCVCVCVYAYMHGCVFLCVSPPISPVLHHV